MELDHKYKVAVKVSAAQLVHCSCAAAHVQMRMCSGQASQRGNEAVWADELSSNGGRKHKRRSILTTP